MFRWCGDSIQLVLNTLMGPSMTLSSDPPACLCLPHLEALIGAAPPTVCSCRSPSVGYYDYVIADSGTLEQTAL